MNSTDLVSAVRLPNNLMSDNAGTEVGSDLIILQKNSSKTSLTAGEQAFIKSRTLSNGININNYFQDFSRVVHTKSSVDTDLYGKPGLVFIHEGGVQGMAADPGQTHYKKAKNLSLEDVPCPRIKKNLYLCALKNIKNQMKKKHLIYLMVMTTTILSACRTKTDEHPKALDIANLDTAFTPGSDFYEYACRGWMTAHPLAPEYARYGAFDKLREENQSQVKDLIEELSSGKAPAGSIAQKTGTLYRMAMDSARLNAGGAAPIREFLLEIEALKDKKDLSTLISKMFRDGHLPFFSAYVYTDDKNSSENIFHLLQGGYRMGDRDYYLLKDTATLQIQQKYLALTERLFVLSGNEAAKAKAAATVVMRIETELAKAAYPKEKLRDPEANYHRWTRDELQKQIPAIDWTAFFAGIGLDRLKDLNVSQPEPLVAMGNIIDRYPLDDLKCYLSWNVINSAADYLSDAFVDASFEFYGKALSGREELRPRWKRSVDVVNSCMGEAVGALYVEKYFPPAAREKMLELVGHLKIALGERIGALPWMTDETKAKAQEKLAAFHVKIGYPDKWRDYSGLSVAEEDSYYGNIVRAARFEFDYMMSKFGKPVDRDEWLMTPQTVNAYYNPTSNEICFPAAILQPPFFNLSADDAVNYGAIGVVIGHEMTHGFDDQGRQFDKDGNLNAWWTPADEEKFNRRTRVLVDFFNNITVLNDVHANGEFTLGENIADQGGLQVSWQAFQQVLPPDRKEEKIDGFTPAQRFFLSYAAIWASNIRDEEILRLTKEDTHSLSRWRVNGALPHIDAWYEAFHVLPGDGMFVPKENRVFIW
jgi:putative endopeptidase